MSLLVRLPYLILEWLLGRGVAWGRELLGFGRDDSFDTRVSMTGAAAPPRDPTAPSTPLSNAPVGEPSPVRPGPPPPTAGEALRRSRARAAASAPAPAPDSGTPVAASGIDAPLRPAGNGNDPGHVDREAEVVESVGPERDVGAALTVDVPWDGYDGMSASAIVARVRAADSTTKAFVRLYESQNKARRTILAATED
jgi:hypothetical protein